MNKPNKVEIEIGKCNELLTNQVIEYIKSKNLGIDDKKLEILRCRLKRPYECTPENDSILIPLLRKIKFSDVEIRKIEKIWCEAVEKML